MSNLNAPFGLRPVTRLDGGIVGRLKSEYNIANALAANIGIGDIVVLTGVSAPANDPRYAGPYITTWAAAGTAPVGVFAGCAYQDNLGNFIWSKNWLTGTVTFGTQGAQAFVFDDPQIIFEAQGNATGFAAANVGQFCGFTGNGAPSTLGISTGVANSTLNATPTTTAILRVYKLSPYPNNAFGAYAKIYTFIATHAFRDPQSL